MNVTILPNRIKISLHTLAFVAARLDRAMADVADLWLQWIQSVNPSG
jgi:hypothetical protein